MTEKQQTAYLRCNRAVERNGDRHFCVLPAGYGTDHPGYGHCSLHLNPGENRAWELAKNIAKELDVSPWEALLWAVRITAGKVAWVEMQLNQAIGLVEADPENESMLGTAVRHWQSESRRERTLMIKAADAAVKAGIAAQLTRQLELEANLLSKALEAALDATHLTHEQRVAAINAAQRALYADMNTRVIQQ